MIIEQYLWGGEGQDVIYGGYSTRSQQIFGNEDDDVIHPGSSAARGVTVRGGKGYDIINPLRDGTTMNNGETFYGDQGNDMIWGGAMN